MDTTTSTIGGLEDVYCFNSGYVSCIKVDGQPILPPLMTEKRREEMRRYREQAIVREKELQERRINETSHITKSQEASATSAQNESSFAKHLKAKCSKESRSVSTSPILGVPATSTPRVRRTYFVDTETENQPNQNKDSNKTSSTSVEVLPVETSSVPQGVLRERKIDVPPLDLSKSVSSVPSADGSSALSYDGDEDKGDADPSESEDQQSEDNFASAASSTGTFVIRRSSENKSPEEILRKTEATQNYTSSSEEEQDKSKKDPPPTVVRKSKGEDGLFTRRKRPAKYFDLDDEETDLSKCSTFSSIPNYISENRSDAQKSSLIADTSGSSCRFSPVPLTNFTSVAKSLTIEFTKKFCTTSEHSSIISTGSKTGIEKSKISSGGSYDVRLSTDIPSSAEKVGDVDEVDAISDSDKENIDMSASSNKHVRKLSYTLATPSAALLEAVSKSKDQFHIQSLETVPSAPSSVDPQSTYQTPEKANIKELEREQGKSSRPQDVRVVGESRGLTNKGLTGLNLGHGKQAHLERFLGEQGNFSETASDKSPHSGQDVQDMQQLLKKIQEQHEIQLRHLAEQHRLQERRIQKDFESELEKIKEKFSTILSPTGSNKASPNSMVSSINNSLRSVPQTTMSESRSIILPISEDITVSEKEQSTIASEQQNKSKNSSVFQFTGGSSMIGDTQTQSSSNITNTYGTGGPTELAGVGLSKLQSRMQLMSPRMFRTPADARSPLLKGLVFLDPLDRPVAPLRIPQLALEPHMKPKFDRISAAVKGFLTRRLLSTEKVQIIIQMIRDTVDLLLKLYEEAPASGDPPFMKPQDNDLHQRLIQQLTGACRSFHDVFFKLSIKERMAIIATDREKLKAKALRSMASPARPNISNATLKSIERRMSHATVVSPKRDYRRARASKAYDPYHGSQSVKPKPIKTFNISPKRRRISYWDERNTLMTRSTPSIVSKQDQNGNNNFKSGSSRSNTSSSSRVAHGSTKNYKLSGAAAMGETFLVPAAVQPSRNNAFNSSNNSSGRSYMGSSSVKRDSVTPPYSKSISARSTQSSISVASSSSGINKSRSSTSRNPWK